MSKIELSGYVTFAEIAAYLNISTVTLRKKIKPLAPFLNKEGTRKRLYSPDEWSLILRNLK